MLVHVLALALPLGAPVAHAGSTPVQQDAPAPEAEGVRPRGPGAGKDRKGKGKRRRRPHWKTNWYVVPSAGVAVLGSGSETTTVASLGLEGGIEHHYVNTPPPTWGGRTRAAVTQQVSGVGSGTDARVGSSFGPHWRVFGIEAGPDLFWNRSTFDGFPLEPTFGLDVPVIGTLRVDALRVHAGVVPTWVSNPDRRVDWSQVSTPGFGHEFAYLAGLSVRVAPLTVGATYVHRITAAGPSRTFAVQADVSRVIRGGGG